LADDTRTIDYTRRHLRFGWWSLLLFATLGLVLESLHGFKVRAYLDVSNETRRLMWTLAHAHGTLLGVLNVVFGLSLRVVPELTGRPRLISPALIGATVLMPAAFFLGGIVFYGGDPGVGVLLLPVGAFLLLAALFWIARGTGAPANVPEARTRTPRR
jgi:hypothetical protein